MKKKLGFLMALVWLALCAAAWAEESKEGICEAKMTLEDGRSLYVSSHDSQVRISLAGFS